MKALRSLFVTLVVMVFLFASTALEKVKAFGISLGEKFHAGLTGYMHQRGMILGAVSLPNGSLVHVASTYGAWKNMTAVTNANPAVATLEAAHGILVADVFEVESGWSRLNSKIVRAASVSTNDVGLEGIDTSLTSIYASGSGTGRIREITAWTQLTQILGSSSSGGEQQFTNYQFLEADGERRIPTTKSAAGITFQVADDPTLAGFILAKAANDDRLQRAVRVTLPSGAKLFYNAYISLATIPSLTVNEVMSVECTLSLLAEPVRYST